MTKRKKQIEIVGFTKASNLLPKDKKIDNKNTPLKTNSTNKSSEKDISNENDQTNATIATQNEGNKETTYTQELNDTDFFNSTLDINESLLVQALDQEQDKIMTDNDRLNENHVTENIQNSQQSNESYASKARSTPETKTPDSKTKEKKYGSPNWCAARKQCKNEKQPSK